MFLFLLAPDTLSVLAMIVTCLQAATLSLIQDDKVHNKPTPSRIFVACILLPTDVTSKHCEAGMVPVLCAAALCVLFPAGTVNFGSCCQALPHPAADANDLLCNVFLFLALC